MSPQGHLCDIARSRVDFRFSWKCGRAADISKHSTGPPRKMRSRASTSPASGGLSSAHYGFIQPQAGGKDVFVHISAVERAGLSTFNEGQHIEYELEENRGKISARPGIGALLIPVKQSRLFLSRLSLAKIAELE
jgi:CspA family cold shock protein